MTTKEALARTRRKYNKRLRKLGLVKAAPWIPREDRIELIKFARELRRRRGRLLPDDSKYLK